LELFGCQRMPFSCWCAVLPLGDFGSDGGLYQIAVAAVEAGARA
jgi:hypothetical protein